jgi:propanol-preferring alcohol dehydrogenase
MKAMQVKKPGGDFELVERPVPEPGEGEVLIKVDACGICHSDSIVKEGLFPGIPYPRSPGHEIVGKVEKVGQNVQIWKKGQRVGVGWYGGHCSECDACRRGDFLSCSNGKICGITYDGGYQEYMTAPQEALAAVPDVLKSEEAAPLLCAGITTYNALRHSGARPGDVVAILGVGGLGHLGVQYAHRSGYKTVAISGSGAKRELAKKLGADVYLSAADDNVSEELQKLGGASVILATAPNGKAISAVIDGLGLNGKLIVVAASPDPIEVHPLQLIGGRKTLTGWSSGIAKDSEDALVFSARENVGAMVETFPLEKANQAYERMMSNQARFRVVLTTGT